MTFSARLPLAVSLLLLASAAMAEGNPTLTLKDGQYVPAEITVPADTKFTLIVKNEDAKPAEFESSDLNREKIVRPHDEITVIIGPLKAGKYAFFDDFNHAATGTMIAK